MFKLKLSEQQIFFVRHPPVLAEHHFSGVVTRSVLLTNYGLIQNDLYCLYLTGYSTRFKNSMA